jgi:hypothetical protein
MQTPLLPKVYPNRAICLISNQLARSYRLYAPASDVRAVAFSTGCESFGAIHGNPCDAAPVQPIVSRRFRAISILFVAASLAGAPYNDYASAKQKLDSIDAERLRPGARVTLTYPELNAWVAKEAPTGVRNPQLRASSRDLATGAAFIDFGKLERSAGRNPGWLMSKFLDGERPVTVTARIRSSAGRATVDIQRVEISGFAIDGSTLDFLIQNFLIPMYPDAVIGKPFELGHRIERLDVSPAAVAVQLK